MAAISAPVSPGYAHAERSSQQLLSSQLLPMRQRQWRGNRTKSGIWCRLHHPDGKRDAYKAATDTVHAERRRTADVDDFLRICAADDEALRSACRIIPKYCR